MTVVEASARRAARPAREHRECVAVDCTLEPSAPDPGGESRLQVSGYVARFGEPRTVEDWLGEFVEVVRAGAFTRTLGNGSLRSLTLEHEGPSLAEWCGAKSDPGAMRLEVDDGGLRVEATVTLPDSRRGRQVRDALEAGRLRAVAAWAVTRCEWLEDGTREVREVKLLDLALTAAGEPVAGSDTVPDEPRRMSVADAQAAMLALAD